MAKPGLYSTARDMLSHMLIKVGDAKNHVEHHVVFDYPDCTRTFDGKDWKVVAKPVFINTMYEGDLHSWLGLNERHLLRSQEVL